MTEQQVERLYSPPVRGSKGRPVAFLGFDAGSPDLVRRWAAEGHLPHFARVLTAGASATVEHEPGVMVGSIWPTTVTGVGVARHGFYTGIRPAPFSYDYVPEAPREEPFWAAVGRSGGRVWTADVPFFAAIDDLDGVQIVEWGCHDRYHGPHSSPAEALAEVVSSVGHHPIGMIDHEVGYERFAPCDWIHLTDRRRSPADVDEYLADLHAAIDLRHELVRHRQALGPFDLTVDVVGETHCAGHHLWSLHDPDHVDHDAAHRARLGGDPLLEVYRRMDAILGDHLDGLDEDAISYVFLSHGMMAHHDGTHLLDDVLWRLDQAYRAESTPWVVGNTARAKAAVDRLPAAFRRRALVAAAPLVRRRLRDGVEVVASEVPHPSQRLWFQVENNTVSGAVRFNRIGREPHGLLSEPLTRHAARWLESELRQIVNLDSGGSVVGSTFLCEELYERSDDDGLPDLFVEWVRDHPVDRVWSPTIGLVERPYQGVRTGDHHATGELVVTGRGIRAGSIGEIRPTDIAPTVAAATGVFLHHRDGEPIEGLLPDPAADARVWHRSLNGLRTTPLRRGHDELDGADLRHELVDLRRDLEALKAAHHETRQQADAAVARATTLADVLATTALIRDADVATDPTISVVMPTCGRRARLARAVASVMTQSHADFELVVVDDATDDGTSDWLKGLEDPRVVVLRNDVRLGEGASRNRALDVVTGEVVTFLDDDNTFDREWLRSVAWWFGAHPDSQVAYGARVVDDLERHERRGAGGLPWLQLNDWDRGTMRERCLVDMNTVAHRRSDVRFDAELVTFTDWDYLLSLTVEVDPVRLPVVAAYYSTDAPHRASAVLPEVERQMYERVTARWAGTT